jgi:hypothetical protein
VQIAHSSRRGSQHIEHIGSARDDVQIEVLKLRPPKRLAVGQDELYLARCPSCGSVSSWVHEGYARLVADGAPRGQPAAGHLVDAPVPLPGAIVREGRATPSDEGPDRC